MTMKDRILELVKEHGKWVSAAKALGLSESYLHRLAYDKRSQPSEETLRKLGLRRVVDYVRIDE